MPQAAAEEEGVKPVEVATSGARPAGALGNWLTREQHEVPLPVSRTSVTK
jgi:hypothetical protein